MTGSTFRQRVASLGPEIAVTPGDPRWDLSRQAFNLALDQRPEFVALPRTEADVRQVVAFAAERGLRVAPQRTGHGAGALGTLEGTVLLRTDGLRGVTVDPGARSARVQAGAQWHDVVPLAAASGLAAMHGSAADVGVVGHTLGGGVSMYGRKHGLASGHVTAMEVVDAEARSRRVDPASDSDLFWALRGGMGNFGVVTAMEFELLHLPELYAGTLMFSLDDGHELLHTWCEWVETVPDEVASSWRIMRFPPAAEIPEPFRGKSFVMIGAVVIGSVASGEELIAPLRRVGPTVDTFAARGPETILGMEIEPPEPTAYSSTHALLDGLSPATMERLMSVVGSGSGSEMLVFELRHLGGALGRPAPGGGAIASIPGRFTAFAAGQVADPAMAQALSERYAMLHDAVRDCDIGLTPNFTSHDTELGRFYEPEVADRLRAIRQARDPDRRFRGAHGLD